MQNRASRDPPALAMTMASSDAMEVARKAFEMAETLISENDELWEPLGVTQGFTAMKRKKQFVPVSIACCFQNSSFSDDWLHSVKPGWE